ncbi:MAG: hypothetical protein QF464_16955, partial [Myxococcota bacterium]|nr:hypothetical protein [Myxococcota bacterium]
RLYAAHCARQLGQLEHCEAQLHAAVEVGRRRGLDGLLARALGELGSLAIAAGDVGAGAACYREALELAEGAGDRRAAATQIGNLGLLALQRCDYVMARDLLRQRLDTMLILRAVEEAADTLTTIAEVELAAGEPKAAEEALHQSLALRHGKRTRRAVRGISCTLVLLARLAREEGQLAKAHGLAERALRAAEAANGPREAAHAHLQLGHVASIQCDRMKARHHLEKAISGLAASGDVLQGLVAEVTLASLSLDEADYATARRLYARASEGFRAHQNPRAAIDATQQVAQLDARMGRLVEAQAALTDALDEARALDYDAAVARIEVNLASARVAAGHTEAGVAGCLAGARRFEALKRPIDQALALLGAGEALVNVPRLDDADMIFTECHALAESLEDERIVRVVAAWRCQVQLRRDGEDEDAQRLHELCDALESAGDVAMALRHRLVLATRRGPNPEQLQGVLERAESIGLWATAAEARAWLLAPGDHAVDAIAAEAEARGYVALAARIRS